MTKVIIAEDMDILRGSLKYMIESDTEMEVVGLARDGQEAFELCCKHKPDIVLMDIKMPGCDGLEGTRLIKATFPAIKVLILTTFDDETSISESISCGADGYITKDIQPVQLQQSIRSVILGFSIFKKNIMDSIAMKMDLAPSHNSEEPIPLTEKEKVLIRLIVEGKSYKEMAKQVSLSEGYVRNMVSDILVKLKLKDRVQLAVYAVKHKII